MGNTIYKLMPGLQTLTSYKKEWLPKDLAAGISVAAISVPIAVAFAGLAGLPPEVGLYSSILPMAVFALFGSSKQLIVGTDSSTCVMVAAILAPFAVLGEGRMYEACLLLSLLTGVLCILGGILRLGFIADFLSKPILTGYLNGLACTIILSQIGKLFGYSLISGGFFRVLINFLSRISETNIIILALGLSIIAFLLVCKKISRKIPAPFIASVTAGVAVYFLGLQNYGVHVVGQIPSGPPPLGIPDINLPEVVQLFPGALSLVLISYCSGMLTGKSFAMKSGEKIDANQEFIGFGAANIASSVSGGFVVSGADSRTAVSDTMGGKSPLTAIIASVILLIIILFLTGPLVYLPIAALGGIIIVSAFALFDMQYLKKLYKVNKREFLLSVFTSIAVMTIGVLEGVLIAIALAITELIARAAKPPDAILAKAPNSDAYQNIDMLETEEHIPDILIYRFESALVFFNSDYFKNRIHELITKSDPKPKWLLLDAGSINHIDITGNDAIEDLVREFEPMGIKVAIARSKKGFNKMVEKSGLAEKIGKENFHLSIRDGVAYIQNNNKTIK